MVFGGWESCDDGRGSCTVPAARTWALTESTSAQHSVAQLRHCGLLLLTFRCSIETCRNRMGNTQLKGWPFGWNAYSAHSEVLIGMVEPAVLIK